MTTFSHEALKCGFKYFEPGKTHKIFFHENCLLQTLQHVTVYEIPCSLLSLYVYTYIHFFTHISSIKLILSILNKIQNVSHDF